MAAFLLQFSFILASLLLHNTAGHTKHSDDTSMSALQILVQQQAGVIQQLSAKVQVLETKMTSLESRVTQRENQQHKQVAFHASFTEGGTIDIGLPAPIIFNNVSINVGNGYNVHTGVFSAPTSGIYLFMLSLKGAPGINAFIGLDKSGTMILETYLTDPTIWKHYGSTIVHVNAGETVFARHYVGTTTIDKWWDTAFTGILLYPD